MWTPLEQFQIISLVSLKMFNLDLSITNLLIVFLLLLFFFIATLQTISKYFTHLKGYFFFIVPNTVMETLLRVQYNKYPEPKMYMLFLLHFKYYTLQTQETPDESNINNAIIASPHKITFSRSIILYYIIVGTQPTVLRLLKRFML